MNQGNGNNGNGAHTSIARREMHIEATDPTASQAEELLPQPQWLAALKSAMPSGEDLKKIMETQVAKARDGNRAAAKFVFDQVHKMQQSERKQPVTIVQNNFYGDDPANPVSAEPKTPKKIESMAQRAAARLPLTQPADALKGNPRPVSDEEEKEIRRREAMRAEE